ncbi:hypothetical protein BBJ28_00016306 [Nothophytophthora sp. Chile5]|nr:hypothetical protein BBJ28_00016306 [Nothophytophthora sp. Chile5]
MATPTDAAAVPAAVSGPQAAPSPSLAAPASSASSGVPSTAESAPQPAQSASAATPPDADAMTDNDEADSSQLVPVPRCSTWFAMDKINPIEKRMLPEFFASATSNASKTAELYLKYRNFMVHAYRQQPSVYLTATACRRNLAGDACSILRVHEFLTHWGLINFHVPPHAMPPAIHPNYALKAGLNSKNSGNSGPIAMLVSAKKESTRRVDAPLACEACGTAREPTDAFFELSSEAKRKATSNGAVAGNGTAQSTAGAGNEGKELVVNGFALRPGSGICEECYIRGAFPDGYDATDFTLMSSTAETAAKAAQWTREETDLLLEAVSSASSSRVKGGEDEDEDEDEDDGGFDWNLVAVKVATKTADECLLHFLELPLLNQTLPSQQRRAGGRVDSGVQALRPFAAGEASNASVLDLSELVEQVDPLVAKAAARAAIGAIKRLHTMAALAQPEAASTGIKVEGNGAREASFDEAAAAVGSSLETAGLAVKAENATADGDVTMEEATASSGGAPVAKEVVAVAEEAASATTVALVATRAQKMADNTATGPVRDLVNQLVENQLRQMELKMQQLSVLEQTLAAEKQQLAQEKYQLYVDRLAFAQEKLQGRVGQMGL